MSPITADTLPWRREAVISLALILAGLILVPVAIWFVGKNVFGGYDGDGFGGFYAELIARLGSGSAVAWFLVLSPLIGVIVIRLTIAAFRAVSSKG